MDNNPKIWVLTDHVVGNSNQSIALAEKLGKGYEIKKIEYNALSKLPNILLKMFPIHIKRSVLSPLKKAPAPEIIICAGRRLAALAVYLKHIHKNHKIRLFQIMKPDINPNEFDAIMLPQHDSFNPVLPNIIRTIGSLHNIRDKVKQAQDQFLNDYPMRRQFVAVLIGGSNKKYDFTLTEAKRLVDILKNIASTSSLKLLITCSRRTPKAAQEYIRNHISPSHIVYSPDDDSPSPYPGMLAQADYIIVTADSVSMCSEAVGTGAPVYLYISPKFTSKKHNYFVQQLIDIGVAKRLEKDTVLEPYKYTPLNELNRVAELIKTRFLT